MAKKKKNKNKKRDKDSLFKNLRKLFKTGNITNKLARKKIDFSVLDKDVEPKETNLRDRFDRIHRNGTKTGLTSISTVQQRKLRYRDYEVMDRDSLNSSVLDIYAEESTLKHDNDQTIRIDTENDDIREELDILFQDILNFNFNAFPWIRNLCKYGDFFLVLEISPNEGVVDIHPFSVYELEREEEWKNDSKEVIFKLIGQSTTLHKPLNNYEVIHFRLLNDTNFLPYGKSILENGRKVWKQVKLMEDAMMVYRIMRAPERRIFYVNVGNLPADEIDNWMEKFTRKIKKEPIIDKSTGELDLNYNIQNTLEDFFFPVRGNEKSTRVETLSGAQRSNIKDDVEFLQKKLFSAYRIPKSFLQYEQELGNKANLAVEDIRFARSVERIQRTVESELRKIAIIHLYSKGFDSDKLTEFDLNLRHSSTLQEQQKIDLLSSKVNLADSAIRDNILSLEWIYKNIFNFSEENIQDVRVGIMKDKKFSWVYEQLERQGENPLANKEEDEEGGDDSDESQSNPFEIDLSKSIGFNTDSDNTGFDSKRLLGYKPSTKVNASNQLGIDIDRAKLLEEQNNS